MRGAVVMIALSGCYAPSVRDCVLACASAADCADGQSCSAGLCAPAGMSCDERQATVDAAPAPAIDASIDAAPDAPAIAYVAVNVAMLGTGSVTIGTATCSAACTVQVPADQPIEAVAAGKGSDVFDAWTSAACQGQPATCTFTPTTTTPLYVWFAKKSG